MMFDQSLDILMVHAQGEIGNVIIGGAPEIPGATILEKMNHINEVDDSLLKAFTLDTVVGPDEWVVVNLRGAQPVEF